MEACGAFEDMVAAASAVAAAAAVAATEVVVDDVFDDDAADDAGGCYCENGDFSDCVGQLESGSTAQAVQGTAVAAAVAVVYAVHDSHGADCVWQVVVAFAAAVA